MAKQENPDVLVFILVIIMIFLVVLIGIGHFDKIKSDRQNQATASEIKQKGDKL